MSKIICLRTIRIAERPNLIWVELETDDDLVGLGESFRGAQATESVLHEQVAPWLIGRDARRIEAVSRHLSTPYLGFHSAGAEIRAASAVDIALWDLAGKRPGLQLGLHAPAAIFQEVVRATLATWYRDLVTDLPVIRNGMVQAPTQAGIGTSLHPGVQRRADASVREFRAG